MYLPAVRYGGPVFAVHGLCRALAAKGHDIEVFTTNVDGPGISRVPVDSPVCLDGVSIRYFASDILRRLFHSPSLARALKQDIAAFDVVHLHSVFLWPTWAAARAARQADVPYLISPRGMLVKELIRRRSWLPKTLWINLIERTSFERAGAIHVTSELERIELEKFGWKLPPVITVANGVDDPEGTAADVEISADVRKLAEGRPLVLYFGRLSWKKGLHRLLQAFALTAGGTLAIAGTDDENMFPRLFDLARRLEIAERVRFLPRTVLGADKEYLFAAAQLFVLPSDSENFGNTVLEAMRRGLPVVVTPEVGAAEIVRAAAGGIVVEGDPASLAAAIARLVDDAGLAAALGKSGQRYVGEYCAWPRLAAKMEILYADLKSQARAQAVA